MSRLDLRALFKNGKKPSENDFALLIESMLNKRDDQFMGRWKAGQTYRPGEVVIHNRGLWEVVPGEDEICASEPPAKPQWQELIILESDGDWKIDKDNGVMYAQVYDLVGIGREYDLVNNDSPEAKLDITTKDHSRYLIFPKPHKTPTLSLFQLEGGPEGESAKDKTYFITGLDNDNVNFLTDTSAFLFRKGEFCENGEESNLQANDGVVLMTIRSGNSGLAQVGISTPDPAGMLDITDQHKGQFIFNPEDKTDPVFSIINLYPETEKNYLATGVGEQNGVFITDAPRGFVFRHGSEYDEYCAQTDINQDGKGLMIIFLDKQNRTRAGIGTEQPEALVDATDDVLSRYQMNPEHKKESAFSMTNIEKSENSEYLVYGLGREHEAESEQKKKGAKKAAEKNLMSIFLSNAPGGYRFNQGNDYSEYINDPQIDQGKTHVVILADGKVGIGTKIPETQLEITDNRQSGRFLFNVDDKAPNPAMAIINTRPDTGKINYLTLGAGNKCSIFITNSDFGYSFRFGQDIDGSNNDVEIEQKSETVFSIRPQYTDSKKIVRPREMRIFPENTGDIPAEVHISGIVGIERDPEEYEFDVEGKIRAIASYLVADRQKMANIKSLKSVLDRINDSNVDPVSFTWDPTQVKNAPEGLQIGFEGQKLREIFPEVVRQTGQEEKEFDTFAVAYQNLVPVLIKAVQELTKKVNDLEERINNLTETGTQKKK